ncbi:hypothetical protein VaNZ11_001124 [Volvox africanus]|uniref:Major facilitator superfamily (MFS) profile domain-containing protein n=1 Tax=Volvox africanus TaxID=51714 RepID=A0ABQ5RNZ9_9CHLO|nr:hypothetical protein VaNZ11_001124 [Volvox africanus]
MKPSQRRQPLLSSTLYQLIVYGNIVLYSICWMAQVPVLPYLVEKLGAAGNTQYGMLQTIFSAVQFVGGLISGPLMDRYGGRFLLAVSFAASVASYFLTATASSMWVLYLSRIPTVLQHAVLAARAIVTHLSSEADRARVLGYVAVSYSVGFMVGPAVGGLLSAVSLQFAAWVATIGSVISLATVLLLLPDLPPHASDGSGHDTVRGAQPHQNQQLRGVGGGVGGDGSDGGSNGSLGYKSGVPASSTEDVHGAPCTGGGGGGGRSVKRVGGGPRQMLMQFVEVARRPGVVDLLTGKLLVGLGSAVFQSMFPVLLKRRYGLDPRTNGMVMSYVGALLLGGQALLVGPVISAIGEPTTEYGCVAALVATYGFLAAAGSLWQLLLLLAPLSVAGMLYNNASTSRLTKATLPQQRGTALAVDMSLSSGVRMLSPALGAAAFDGFGHRAVPTLAAALIGGFLLAVQLGVLQIPLKSKAAAAGSGSVEELSREIEGLSDAGGDGTWAGDKERGGFRTIRSNIQHDADADDWSRDKGKDDGGEKRALGLASVGLGAVNGVRQRGSGKGG